MDRYHAALFRLESPTDIDLAVLEKSRLEQLPYLIIGKVSILARKIVKWRYPRYFNGIDRTSRERASRRRH